jgi:large subunit ribosomal protein L7A
MDGIDFREIQNIQKKYRKSVDFSEFLRIIRSCMDMQTDCQSTGDIRPSEMARHRVVVGAKQLRKALLSGSAQQVYLARNADPALTEPIAALCQNHNVPYTWVKSKTELGQACGIEVGAAAAATVK